MRLAVLIAIFGCAAFAAERCAVCHPKESAALARTGMGRSFRLVGGKMPEGEFRHQASGSTVAIRGAMHAIRRGREQVKREVRYVIGSGNVGMSFVLRSGEWLYQSPASYFSARRAWGPSPGYENDSTLDFSRPITDECVFCHSGSAEWVEGSINRFRDPAGSLDGIPCERCHGGGDAHIARPERGNITNPARLTGEARDSVCEQCHLGGVSRVLNPGKRWADFVPGRPLEDTWSVYIAGQRGTDIDVVSHVEQLAASACARGSQGKLWCGSCHSVHGEKAAVSIACRSCHDSAHHADKVAERGSCADCHMPRRTAADGGHTAFTDHRIQRRPEPMTSNRSRPLVLQPWRPARNSLRNEGLANIHAGDKLQSAEMMQRGFALLAEHQREFNRDPNVLAALGYVLFRKNRPAEAAALLDRAAVLAPKNVRFRLNLGLALAAVGDAGRARKVLEEVLALDPSVEAARTGLRRLGR